MALLRFTNDGVIALLAIIRVELCYILIRVYFEIVYILLRKRSSEDTSILSYPALLSLNVILYLVFK